MLRVHHNSTSGARAGFYADQEIKLTAGNRLVILGRKGQGTSIFLRSLIGEVYTVNGLIKL
jgi:ABC-type hemin transport system ATPase subunit